MKFDKDELIDSMEIVIEEVERCHEENSMWRKRELENMIFVDSQEEKWFTEMLLNLPSGLRNPDEYAEFMLRGYRETREKN